MSNSLNLSVIKNKLSIHERNIIELAELVITRMPNVKFDHKEIDSNSQISKKQLISDIINMFMEYMKRYIEHPDYLCIIRWFYTQKLIDFENKDPLLPYNEDDNEGLYHELEKINVPNNEIRELSNKIHNMIMNHKTPRISPRPNITVENDVGTDYVIRNNNVKFVISNPTYIKLKFLYQNESLKFHERLFNLLCRYEALSAPGYHAAIPQKLFHLLHKELKIQHEMFASPFNCNPQLMSYTSAYPDTDQFFGSKGNFFNKYPELLVNGGSFEANPPFLEEHMMALTLIILKELEKNNNPLSFVVIYPAWLDSISLKLLIDSQHNILMNKFIMFDRDGHYYMQSSQYWHKYIDRRSNSKSVIFILQNEGGRKEYPVSDELLNQIEDNFKNV